jgi:hypothetical protein
LWRLFLVSPERTQFFWVRKLVVASLVEMKGMVDVSEFGELQCYFTPQNLVGKPIQTVPC